MKIKTKPKNICSAENPLAESKSLVIISSSGITPSGWGQRPWLHNPYLSFDPSNLIGPLFLLSDLEDSPPSHWCGRPPSQRSRGPPLLLSDLEDPSSSLVIWRNPLLHSDLEDLPPPQWSEDPPLLLGDLEDPPPFQWSGAPTTLNWPVGPLLQFM